MSAKKYLVQTEDNRCLLLFISQQPTSQFIATLIWYDKSGEWTQNTLRTDWDAKHFLAESCEAAYKTAIDWATMRFGENLNVQEKTEKE